MQPFFNDDNHGFRFDTAFPLPIEIDTTSLDGFYEFIMVMLPRVFCQFGTILFSSGWLTSRYSDGARKG